MIKLNEIELQYLELRMKSIQIADFEKWVYMNEVLIRKTYSNSVYDDLIILDYESRQSKSILAKLLAIDFEKLEKYQLQEVLIKLIESDNLDIGEISHNKYDSVYDPHYRSSFGFKINQIRISINNPFDFGKGFNELENEGRAREFKKRFKSPKKFFEMLLDELESQNLKVVVFENLEDVGSNDYVQKVSGSKEDILLFIDRYRVMVNKKILNLKMQEYWQ